ncbi:hypothetical protein O6P43_009659 [Quillaja saponaria]|uniref:Uncharacterized protein n=1 Tax=Quillaja saponaria TaxID=32244 RepID=A0AAD7VD98_QUISA|nr:hypothetical protein O6P43_009659 [Quillaja saponaria]
MATIIVLVGALTQMQFMIATQIRSKALKGHHVHHNQLILTISTCQTLLIVLVTKKLDKILSEKLNTMIGHLPRVLNFLSASPSGSTVSK